MQKAYCPELYTVVRIENQKRATRPAVEDKARFN